jgi:hypothetical protein
LKTDGTVVAWGYNGSGQTTVPPGLTGVTAIAAGDSHSLALKTDGTVVAWGDNWSGQTTVPPGLTGVTAIAAGNRHNLALVPSQLPEGLSCSTDGLLSGMPTLAGTNVVTFVTHDSLGATTNKSLEIVIAANPNTRPVISSNAPSVGTFITGEATSQLFEVVGYDPEGGNLTYLWTWDGLPVGGNSNSYTHTAAWGDAGSYVLRCYVSDDLWQSIVYLQWTVTVLDDNDSDGMPNLQELDLGRDPNNPADGGAPSTLMGAVTGAGLPLEGAEVELRGAANSAYHQVLTDPQGAFTVHGVAPGHYFVKVGAESYADEWHSNANHRTNAVPYTVPAGSIIGGFNFDLASGQSPASVQVTSDPAGAEIYLDYWPTDKVTPAVLNVGEAGEQDWAGYPLASHVITLKKAGLPRPPPQSVSAAEAETVLAHFDLAPGATGAVSVATTPAGAEVYVDYANAPDGITPITVSNLAPGSHTILLRKSGQLHPRPITASVFANETTEVQIPLQPDTAVSRVMAEVKSVPQGIPIYVDYLPSGQVTDAVVASMDPASHTGSGWIAATQVIGLWQSASHTILLRRPGAPPMAARYVPNTAGTAHWMLMHLSVDPTGLNDCDGDGIPDWWWEQHGFDPCNPPDPQSPADGSGMSYKEKFLAGLVPGDPNSRFETGNLDIDGNPGTGRTITFVFDTVPGRRYVVQARAKLTEGAWTNISGAIGATAAETMFTAPIPSGAAGQFYRVIVLAP